MTFDSPNIDISRGMDTDGVSFERICAEIFCLLCDPVLLQPFDFMYWYGILVKSWLHIRFILFFNGLLKNAVLLAEV